MPSNDAFYQRFHGWKVASPMIVNGEDCRSNPNDTTANSCFGSDSKKLYFEYCNVVEEDYLTCNTCGTFTSTQQNQTCTTANTQHPDCSKIIRPFPSGWTTFVVSASIPYKSDPKDEDSTNTCSKDTVPFADVTGSVCFMQRVELFYPELCPQCHACPHIRLGDTFGPLEVVGLDIPYSSLVHHAVIHPQ
jgi:hypothetical protein